MQINIVMASASSTAASAALSRSKEQVESELDKLLTSFKDQTHTKLMLCKHRQALKCCLDINIQDLAVDEVTHISC